MKHKMLYLVSIFAGAFLFSAILAANQTLTKAKAMKTLNAQNPEVKYVMQGRLDACRSSAIYSSLFGADFHTAENGSIYFSSGIDCATFNGIIEHDERAPSEKDIKKAIEFFHERKLPFIWWTSSKNLENYGFQFGGILTGIIADISQNLPPVNPTSSQLKIKIVSSKEDLKAFTDLVCNVFDMNGCLEKLQSIFEAIMNNKEQLNFLALMDGKPVGALSLYTSPSSAGIWNLVTLEDYRQQGIGTALVNTALIEAQKRKYDKVMAILMPKGMAFGLFTKLGFKEVCHFPFYVYGASAESLEK